MINTILKKILGIFINWDNPLYSRYLYEFSRRYLDLWYGDNNFDRKTNGEYRLLSKILPNCRILFDVGANVGSYSGEALKINPEIIIHAFEPDPRAFEKLKLVKGINTINNTAVGERRESKMFNQNPQSTHNSFHNLESNSKTIAVLVNTIDLYCREKSVDHIDFLKIDVEGHELFVLKGADGLLKKQAIDYVQFEFSGAMVEARTFLLDFIRLFDICGYDLYRIRAKDIQKVDYFPDRERFTLTNYLAVRRGIEVTNN